MPLYEYQCKKCGHRFEKIEKFSDPETKQCTVCDGEVERLLSAPAVQFKGTGWYATDYAKKSGGPSSSSGSNDKSSSSGNSGSGSGEGSAKKPESAPSKSESKS